MDLRIYIILFIIIVGCTNYDQKGVVNELQLINGRLVETIESNLGIMDLAKIYNSNRFQFLDSRRILETYESSKADDVSDDELLGIHQFLIDSLMEVSWHYTEPWKTHVAQILERHEQSTRKRLNINSEINNEIFYNLVLQFLDKYITEVHFWNDMKYPIISNQRIIDDDWAELTVEIGTGPFSQKNIVILHIDTLEVNMNEHMERNDYIPSFEYRYRRNHLKDSIVISVSNTNVNAPYRVNSAKKFELKQE